MNTLLLFIISGLAVIMVLSGCGNQQPTFSLMPANQVFKQNPGVFNNQLDILFVVDNSGSMAAHQENLASNFSTFISGFKTKGFDYKIAVTGTDAYLANTQLVGYNSANAPVAKFRDRAIDTGSGVYKAITNDNECGSPAPHTGIFVITPATPSINSVFAINAKQCTRGHGDERAFSSFMTSLTSPLNSGFLRPQSFLAVIIVSDEDDFSGYTRAAYPGDYPHDYEAPTLDPVGSYVTQLDNLTGSTATTKRYNVSNISSTDPSCVGNGDIHYPNRYMQLSSLTEGVSGSICDPSFANALDQIQRNITELSTQFFLDRVPQVNTIVATVNGTNITQSATNGWTYKSSANSILFHGSAIPPQGATISVSYVPETVIK
jgi:hypothetical protein